MATPEQQIIANAFIQALTDWQVTNLARHRSCRFCCGGMAWKFWAPPNRYAPEVVANCEELPILSSGQEVFPEEWGLTFKRMCQVSGTIQNCYNAWLSDSLGQPLTHYSAAIERATTYDVRRAIDDAAHARRVAVA